MFRRVLVHLALAAALLTLAGCDRRPADYRPAVAQDTPGARSEFTFAVHPLHNPQLLFATYGPLIDHLNRELPGIQLRLVASNTYAVFENRLAAGEFDFALPNPYQTLRAQKSGYEIFGKMADDDQFRGVILVRKDSGITRAEQLRGRFISYPAPTALAAAMMPQQFLRTQGLKRGESHALYVGSQESSIDSVYHGVSAAGATWPPPWQAYAHAHPEVAAAVEVRWETAPLVNNGLVARASLPADVRQSVARALFNLGDTAEGRQILKGLGVSAFTPATAATYVPVATFIRTFEAAGGPDPPSTEQP